MALPKFLQPYLASYDLSSLDIKKDKDLIITEVLNKGDDKALGWVCKAYNLDEIKSVIQKPTRGVWEESVLKYWLKILDINLPKETFKKAVINLNSY